MLHAVRYINRLIAAKYKLLNIDIISRVYEYVANIL